MGECKWCQPDYADRQLRELKAKVAKVPLLQGKDIVFALFLREPPLSQADCHICYPVEVIANLPE